MGVFFLCISPPSVDIIVFFPNLHMRTIMWEIILHIGRVMVLPSVDTTVQDMATREHSVSTLNCKFFRGNCTAALFCASIFLLIFVYVIVVCDIC
jgi:hypothetical protein